MHLAVPKVIRLLGYEKLPRQGVKLNRRNIYARDSNRCQYVLGIFDEQPGTGNDYQKAAQQLKCPALVMRSSLFFIIPDMISLCRTIRKQKVVIICSHDYKSNLYALLAGKILNLPTMAVFHGRTRTDRKALFYESFDNLLLPYFDTLICVSEHTKTQLQKIIKKPPPVYVIPNAIPLEPVNKTTTKPLPETYRRKDNRKQAVFAGRLCSEKGIFDLIRAAAKVIDKRDDITFLILGDGPEKDHLKKTISDNGLTNFIHLLGFTNSIFDYYRSMDFLILPSLSESMPMVILEAFSLKKPVIATSVGGIPEIVQHGKTGLLVKPGDANALARAIESLLDNPQKAEEMGNNGYAHISAHHTIEAQAAHYFSIYEQVLNSSISPQVDSAQ